MDKIPKQPYIGMNKWPSLYRVLGYIEDKINQLVDFANTPPSAPTNPKVYRALLSQSGTDAPTAIVLENTLGEVPTFEYIEAGNYKLKTVAEIFDISKTHSSECLFINQTDDPELSIIKATVVQKGTGYTSYINIRSTVNGVLIDLTMEKVSIEILVYE